MSRPGEMLPPARAALIERMADRGMTPAAIRFALGDQVSLAAIQAVLEAARARAADAAAKAEAARAETAARRAVGGAIAAYRAIEVIPAEGPRTLAAIAAEVATARGLTVRDLRSDGRSGATVAARQEAMFRAAAETHLSAAAIGRFFHRDHTTAIHAIRSHARRNGLVPPRGMTPYSEKEMRHD